MSQFWGQEFEAMEKKGGFIIKSYTHFSVFNVKKNQVDLIIFILKPFLRQLLRLSPFSLKIEASKQFDSFVALV